jgi:hypothetical protein
MVVSYARPRLLRTSAHRIGFLKVEDQVQLAHVSEIPIKDFDVTMHDLERDQLVVRVRDGGDEEERGVATVDYFGVCWKCRMY